MASASYHRQNPWNGISRGRGRPAVPPKKNTGGSAVLMQNQPTKEDQPKESVPPIDPNKLRFDKSVTNSNVHDIFIKSIPTVDDCELRFRRALRHHAFKFGLGDITLAKIMSQPRSKSTTIAFVRFAQVALHPQIVQSLEGASWHGKEIFARINPRRTKLSHFPKKSGNQETGHDKREAALHKLPSLVQQEYLRALESENRTLKLMNESLHNMKIEAEGEWDYLKCVRTQFQVKLTSQLVREKNLNVRKRAVRIREAQLEYNEKRFSERLADEVDTRVKARLSNLPEPPPIFGDRNFLEILYIYI
ncbi:hypothetical protein BpHYR1_053353 [Brachionus plicatilis]|uniref:Uncharacterized protein n=1 Tax=Brachionus plicatilis TaxID=10195 RepID=A0A3M7QW25_BRAPC|nr:hypothetical protein BpHYR1_053353 [Brachionus plicatilis]